MVEKNNFNPRVLFVLGGVVFFIFIIMMAIYAYFYWTGNLKAAAYMNAPQCSSGQQSEEADCRRLSTAKVEQVFTTRAGRARNHMARFQLPDGTRLEVDIPIQEFWQHLQSDEQVTIEIWRSQITRIKTADGNDQPTAENPDWNGPNLADGILPVVATFGIFGIILMITGRLNWKRT